MTIFATKINGGGFLIGSIFEDEKMPELSKEEIIAAMKEGAKEWLQDLFAEVGKWTLTGAVGALVVALLYFVLAVNGWKRP